MAFDHVMGLIATGSLEDVRLVAKLCIKDGRADAPVLRPIGVPLKTVTHSKSAKAVNGKES